MCDLTPTVGDRSRYSDVDEESWFSSHYGKGRLLFSKAFIPSLGAQSALHSTDKAADVKLTPFLAEINE